MTGCTLDHLLKPQKKPRGSSVLTTPLMWWYSGEYRGTELLLFIFVRKRWKHRPLCIKSLFWRLLWSPLLIRCSVARVDWTFQQDFAGPHAAKNLQKRLEENIPTRKEDRTSGSPDLNPLYYEIWEKLEEMACEKPIVIWSHWSKLRKTDRHLQNSRTFS